MYSFNCKINNEIQNNEECALFVDLSNDISRFENLMTKTVCGDISGFYLIDHSQREKIVLKISDSDRFLSNALEVSANTAEMIIKLCNDCISGNAFQGYHVDFETSNAVIITFWLNS